jgi:ribosome maturation protein Sdo1
MISDNLKDFVYENNTNKKKQHQNYLLLIKNLFFKKENEKLLAEITAKKEIFKTMRKGKRAAELTLLT